MHAPQGENADYALVAKQSDSTAGSNKMRSRHVEEINAPFRVNVDHCRGGVGLCFVAVQIAKGQA